MKRAQLLILIFILLFSCKYEDGPFISLRSKENRLIGEWQMEMNINTTRYWKFDKNHNFKEIYFLKGVKGTYYGQWELSNKNENIKLTYTSEEPDIGLSSFPVINYKEILRLTNKELWVDDDRRLEFKKID